MEGSVEMEGTRACACARTGGTGSLAVLQDVHRAYQQRMAALDRLAPCKRQKLQTELLRAWVRDLAEQNSLLAHTVEELEEEATSRLILRQKKHSEVVCELRAELCALRRRLQRKDSDLRGMVEVLRRLREYDYCTLDGIHFFEITKSDIFGEADWSCEKRCLCGKVNELKQSNDTLHKENVSKDREIKKLHKDVHQYEQTILNLRNEISLTKYHSPDVSKRDAEVMAGMCCTGAECGDWEPVKEFDSILRGEMARYQERIQKMECILKASGEDVRALRKANVVLHEELQAARGVAAALGDQCRVATQRSQFKDEIIREMRRQLKHAKAKTREAAELVSTKSRSPSRDPEVAFETVNMPCVRQQPRRSRDPASPPARSLSADGVSPRLVVSKEDLV